MIDHDAALREIERVRLVRQVRQRLHSLGLAGVDRVLSPQWRPTRPLAPGISRISSAPIEMRSVVDPSTPTRIPDPVPIPHQEIEPVSPPPPPRQAPVQTIPVLAPSMLFQDNEFATPVLELDAKVQLLEQMRAEVAACQSCPLLVASRTQTVFGSGDPNAELMFIGEAPGEDEDRLGQPFIGRAGQLLTDMITKGMGLSRSQVYIANAVKCRPSDAFNKNRAPNPIEITTCNPFIERQVEIVRPKFICLLGKSAASAILQTQRPMSALRGKWFKYKGIPVIVTFHPSYLLRTPQDKRLAWEDLKLLMQAMRIQPPKSS